MLARSNDVHYKEKRKHTADNSTTETTPRKRPLSDAFKVGENVSDKSA